MMYVRTINTKPANGFSLLELLLVIVVMALLMTGAIQIFNDWIEKSTNRTAVRQMLMVQNAAEEYVTANFSTILTTIPNNGNATALPYATLRSSGYLPQNFPTHNIFRQPFAVVLINGGVTDQGDIIQVLSVTTDDSEDRRVPETRLLDASLAGGPSIGMYSVTTAGAIRSSYGEWSVDQLSIQTVYNPSTPDNRNGGYLAAYGQVSVDDVTRSDYLYRVPMFDSAGNRLYQLNRMATDLDMGGHVMQSAAAMSVDQMRVEGEMVIEGENITTAGFNPYALSVDEVFSVAGNDSRIGYAFSEDSDSNCRFVTIAGEVRVDDALVGPGGTCLVVGGQMTVHGDTDDLTADVIVPTMTVDGDTVGGIANIQNTPTFGEAQFDAVNANTINAGRMVSDRIISTGTSIATQEIRSGNSATFSSVNLTSGNMVAGNLQMPAAGQMIVDGNLDVEQTYETYGDYISSGSFNAVRTMDMDLCEGHADCFDPNLVTPLP